LNELGTELGIDVIVRDGTVELWGTLLDERKHSHRRSRKCARCQSDHLVYVEPISGMAIGPPEPAASR
jgi:hypothetical protein